MLAGEVRWLKEQVQTSGARLAVVFVPCRETIYASQASWANEVQEESPAIVACLREVTSKQGIPFADLTPVIRERARQLDEPLYYNGQLDTHPTPKGYRIMAEAVTTFLSERRIIPNPPSD
jgi:lysophospholipase L1-like esterase